MIAYTKVMRFSWAATLGAHGLEDDTLNERERERERLIYCILIILAN